MICASPSRPAKRGRRLSIADRTRIALTLPLTTALNQALLALESMGNEAATTDGEWTYYGPSVGGASTGPLPIVIIETIIGFIKLDAISRLGWTETDGPVQNLAYSEYQLQTVDYAVGLIGELQRVKIPFTRYPAPYMSALNAIFDVLSYESTSPNTVGYVTYAQDLKPDGAEAFPLAPWSSNTATLVSNILTTLGLLQRNAGPGAILPALLSLSTAAAQV